MLTRELTEATDSRKTDLGSDGGSKSHSRAHHVHRRRTDRAHHSRIHPLQTALVRIDKAAVALYLAWCNVHLFSLWAWTALEYFKEVYCGQHLNEIERKYKSYSTEHQQSVYDKVQRYRRQCDEGYIDTFTEQARPPYRNATTLTTSPLA